MTYALPICDENAWLIQTDLNVWLVTIKRDTQTGQKTQPKNDLSSCSLRVKVEHQLQLVNNGFFVVKYREQ